MSDQPEASTSTKTVVSFFKKPNRSRPASSRKRSISPPPSDPSASASSPSHPSLDSKVTSSVIRPQAKSSFLNPLVQGTKRSREKDKERTRSLLEDSDWKANEGLLAESEERRRGLATRSKDWDLETLGVGTGSGKGDDGAIMDGEEAEERLSKKSKTRTGQDGIDGLYHGAGGYNTYIQPKEVMNSKVRAGPIKATSSIRTVTTTDYQPDVCKDYKETGFCGYGDSCKFLHDRGDYLAGWQLDKLAVNPTTGQTVEEESDDDDDVPFACLICRQRFTEPVVTKCGHYFCMDCAIKRFAKTPKCYACGAPTGGMFNKAEKILAKLNAAQAAKMERRKRDAFGELKSDNEDSGDDDEGGIQFEGGDSGDQNGHNEKEE